MSRIRHFFIVAHAPARRRLQQAARARKRRDGRGRNKRRGTRPLVDWWRWLLSLIEAFHSPPGYAL